MARNRRHIHLVTTGANADERLVTEYVLQAVERLSDRPECDEIGFVRAGHKPIEGGLVVLSIEGDVDAVMAHERDRWDALVEEGLVEHWRVETPDVDGHLGENGARLRARFETLASLLSKQITDEFETLPHPVDAYPSEADDRESPTGTGWWTLLHLLSIQQGYYYDAEVEAYAEGIRDAAHKLAQYEDPDTALDTLEDTIDSLESVATEIDRYHGADG